MKSSVETWYWCIPTC